MIKLGFLRFKTSDFVWQPHAGVTQAKILPPGSKKTYLPPGSKRKSLQQRNIQDRGATCLLRQFRLIKGLLHRTESSPNYTVRQKTNKTNNTPKTKIKPSFLPITKQNKSFLPTKTKCHQANISNEVA